MSLLLFAPMFACLFWALMQGLFVFRTPTCPSAQLLLVLLGAYLWAGAVYALPSASPSLLCAAFLSTRLSAPALLPLSLLMFRRRSGTDLRLSRILLWLLLILSLFLSGLVFALVTDRAVLARFVADYHVQGFAVRARYAGTPFEPFFWFFVMGGIALLLLQVLSLVFVLRPYTSLLPGQLRQLRDCFRKGAAVSPMVPLLLTMALTGGLLLVAALIPRSWHLAHPALAAVGALGLTAVVSLLGFLLLFVLPRRITLADLSTAFRFNGASPADLLPVAPPGAAGASVPASSRAQDIFDAAGAFPEDNSLRTRFQHLMVDEQLFLTPGLTLADVADRLHSNKTYVSRLVNSVYNLGFPELMNTLRVDYAEQYLLAHRSARQDEIARACGFLSASSFNNTFKKVTGYTPKVWLDGFHRED